MINDDLESKLYAQQIEKRQFVTMYMGDQMFGVDVSLVRDVLQPQKISPIPLSPPEIEGSLNLRGRIVTAVNVAVRLGIPSTAKPAGPNQKSSCMNIVVELKEELYSLQVNKIGEVLMLPVSEIRANPENMAAKWQAVSSGIYQLKENLLIILDIAKLLEFASVQKTEAN